MNLRRLLAIALLFAPLSLSTLAPTQKTPKTPVPPPECSSGVCPW